MATTSSMTGAGFAAGDSEVGPVRIEARSVNGRGLSVKLRLSSVCGGYENAIEERARERLRRGSVTLVVERGQRAAQLPERAVLLETAHELRRLADELQLPKPTLADVLQAASGGRESATSRPLPPQLAALVDHALDELVAHRHADGRGTVAAIEAELVAFEGLVAVAAARAPQLIDEYRARLLQRVQDFVAANLPEPPPAVDLVREVAVFADRVDVAEELQRLQAHVAEVRALLGKGGEVGRRLDFLQQELLRETNTLGSKSPDTAVAHAVVAMKSHIATIKEQAANLE